MPHCARGATCEAEARAVLRDGLEAERKAPAARRGDFSVTKTKPKPLLSNTRLIPFNKLVLSQANVRRVSNGVSIEDLVEDIAHQHGS